MALAQAASPYSMAPVTIEGHDRALESVLDQVQLAFRFPIYYEELPLENQADLIIVSAPGGKREPVSPVSELTVSLTNLDSTPYLAIQTVLSAYAYAGYPGGYKVVPRDHRIDVLPAEIRASSGPRQSITPILTMPITFPLANRTVADTVQLILDTASRQSGYPILIVRGPGFNFRSVELGANGEAVGDVLEKLGAALGSVYSVALRYVPPEKAYYFDMGGNVFPPNAPGRPAVSGGKLITSTHGPSNSPFFTKDK